MGVGMVWCDGVVLKEAIVYCERKFMFFDAIKLVVYLVLVVWSACLL